MFKKLKKRHISIILFYFLLILLGVSILIDPVIPARAQDVIIGLLVISNIHFLNERNILFKRIKIFAEDIEENKRKDKQKEDFVANITHDLKTPTCAQISTIKLLLNDKIGFLNKEQKNLLKNMLASCSYVSNIINSILDTYKYKKGEIKLELEDFNFKNVVHQICLNLSDLAYENEQNIILEADENILIHADKLQIARVITNLIGNAIKYGNKKEDISICIKNENNNTCFEVKNGYKNLNEQELNKLFEKYLTTDKNSSGLGLYISKKIIEEHSGNIFVKKENNKICFGFILPLTHSNVCAA